MSFSAFGDFFGKFFGIAGLVYSSVCQNVESVGKQKHHFLFWISLQLNIQKESSYLGKCKRASFF